ncbi:MAG: 50S ribosomal protein L29 [Nitrospina sp.]|nr:MAG: 50S ribosomal protein L29 [Nitrospina sp.]
MKMQEVLDLSEKEREEKLKDLQEEYFNLKFQLATGKIENPGRLKHMRRDMARIKTLENRSQPDPQAAGTTEEKPAGA